MQRPGFRPVGRAIPAHRQRRFLSPTKKPFVDKTLHNYLCCGLIHAALPQAKVILMLRGPMATAWALYKALFTTGYLFSYELADIADYYLAYRRLVEHWRDIIPPGALLTVTYEDVVRCPAEQSARILEFLGLPGKMRRFAFTKAGRHRPQPARSR